MIKSPLFLEVLYQEIVHLVGLYSAGRIYDFAKIYESLSVNS